MIEELGASPTYGSGDVTISVRVPNIPLLVGPPEAIVALVDRIMGNAAHVALVYLSDALAAAVPRNQGELASSFQADPATDLGGIELTGHTFAEDAVVGRVFSALPYAAAMDAGRRPGAPISREGIEAIGIWAQQKLGLDAAEADRAKWAIAMSIKAQGIPAHRYADAALLAAEGGLGAIFAHTGEAIAEALAGSV